jgi:hypothetical protein
MAGDATLDAVNAAITLRSSDDLTLGQVTGQRVSLVSSTGGVRDQGTNGATVVADQLRISAIGSIGTSVQALTVEVDTIAINASSVYLIVSGDTAVGTVGASFNRVLSNLSNVTVTDAAISGIVSSGLINLETIGGDLDLLATAGVLTVAGDGSITINIEGNLIGNAAITSGTGSISLDATESATLSANVASASGDISLVALQDLRLINGADITSGSAGNLYLEATNGVIEMSGETLLSTGSGTVILLGSGSLVLGDISTTGDISLTSEIGSVTGSGSGTNTLIGNAVNITA